VSCHEKSTKANAPSTVSSVTVDGEPLGEHYDVKRFTKFGFEWTYEGEVRSSWRWRFWRTILATMPGRSGCPTIHETNRGQSRQ